LDGFDRASAVIYGRDRISEIFPDKWKPNFLSAALRCQNFEHVKRKLNKYPLFIQRRYANSVLEFIFLTNYISLQADPTWKYSLYLVLIPTKVMKDTQYNNTSSMLFIATPIWDY
jgi:hypothetical protein